MMVQKKFTRKEQCDFSSKYSWFLVRSLWIIFLFVSPSKSISADLPSCDPFHEVPYHSPSIEHSSFEIIPNLKSPHLNDVIIYWQTIDDDAKCDSKEFGYQAFYALLVNQEIVWVPSNITRENYAIFVGLLSYIGHSIRIYSSNIHGLSKVYSKLFVPGKSDRLEKPFNLQVSRNEYDFGTFMLTWEHNSVRNDNFTLKNNIESPMFTIFWCEAFNDEQPYQCSGYLDWTSSFELKRLERLMRIGSDKKFQFAISISGRKESMLGYFESDNSYASSGMVWQSCSDFTHLRKTVDKFWVSFVSPSIIGLRWKVECNGWNFFNQPLPYGDPDILQEVSYCELDKTTNNCPYLGAWKSLKNFEENMRTSEYAIITNLKPNTSYVITIIISYSHSWITNYNVFKTKPECMALPCE